MIWSILLVCVLIGLGDLVSDDYLSARKRKQ